MATFAVEEKNTGLIVAKGSAPTADEAIREATHYALQYGQDGPVRFCVKEKGKILVQGSMDGHSSGVYRPSGADEIERLEEVCKALREWIDAVPKDMALPSMPGVDRDWVDSIIDG